MSSKRIDITNYGSLDGPEAVDNIAELEQETSQVHLGGSLPPKPAVRHRTKLHRAATTSCDSSSSSDEAAKKIKSQEELKTRLQAELSRELVEYVGKRARKSLNDLPVESSLLPVKKSLSLPLATQERVHHRAYPKKVFFIIGNEFCERFSYYGLRTLLVLYFKNVLGFSDSNSTVSFHIFAALCYLTPILGGILGDSVWGKFKTILYMSIVYFVGEFILVISSIFWHSGGASVALTFAGLFLVGLGTGGIKPCVSALGGDQFQPDELKWRQTFFSMFYASINIGSLISTFLTPLLRSSNQCVGRPDCYPLAFGVPCALMFIAVLIFAVAKNHYNLVPLPEKNIIVEFASCVWLAAKRKLRCQQVPDKLHVQVVESLNKSNMSVISSSSSASSVDYRLTSKSESTHNIIAENAKIRNNNKHWLYLAADRFDSKSIEDFRSVLSIAFLFLPLSVYYCLYDQQGSLWTLQASRMDGQLFNTGLVILPDQMSVMNPLLMLAFIPIFDLFIYPALGKYNVLQKPIQRITVGGFLAAVTFVLSALIEMRIQQFTPATIPQTGHANLLLINGLSDCRLFNPQLSYVQTAANGPYFNQSELSTIHLEPVEPLGVSKVELQSANPSIFANNRLHFKLTSSEADTNSSFVCPFNAQLDQELDIQPLEDKSVNLLYLEQGNGKLSYKTFKDSLQLPASNKARVRLLYEFFGSSVQAKKRQFSLSPSQNQTTEISSNTQLVMVENKGQILISEYLDVEVSSKGDLFKLHIDDPSIGTSLSQQMEILLKPATRNLIIVQQKDFSNVELKHKLLQDNDFRVSLLYQIAPYVMISISEVMLSITTLDFAYSMAPDNMKSIVLAMNSIVVALGNMLTIVLESIHMFDNQAHDFLFYASIMTVDMMIFAIIGYYFKPRKTSKSSRNCSTVS